ncbi:MAG: hypothetical protein WC498_03925 [Candidatus Saccharimonadales bacterium]
MAVIVGAVFVTTRSGVISTVNNTAYPGKRDVPSGGYDFKQLLVTYLQPQLERTTRGTRYVSNQSESSNFILLSVAVFLPSVALLLYLYIKHKKLEWVLLLLVAGNLLFLAHLFLPPANILTKLFLLHLVPQQRLMIGLGFLGIITLVYSIHLLSEYLKGSRVLVFVSLGYAITYLALGLWAGLETRAEYPLFVSNFWLILALDTILCLGMFFVFARKFVLGLGILAALSLVSIVRIHPIYRGLGPVIDKRLQTALQNISSATDVWGSVDNFYLENVPQMSNRPAVTGVDLYPNNAFWKNYVGGSNESIYNRYAHVLLFDQPQSIRLVQADLFVVSYRCDQKLTRFIKYELSSMPLDTTCRTLERTVQYPAVTFYIYKIQH